MMTYLEDRKMRDLDVAQIVSSEPRWRRVLLRVVRRQVNRVASRIVLRAYERGVINSHQMHHLCAQFDPTQNGVMGKL